MSTKALMTAEQFAQMETADTEDYELMDRKLIPSSGATPGHAHIRGLAVSLIRNYYKGNPVGKSFGEINCEITGHTVRRPDVSIFLDERLKQIDLDTIPGPFAPVIAVRVLSPNERAMVVRRRVRDCWRAGTKEVWLLDHANAEVLIPTSTGIRVLQGADGLESPLLPGFSVAVADLVVNV